MKPIVLDFETYHDSEYSLRKMTTPEYVMDDRFQVLNLAYYDFQERDSGTVSADDVAALWRDRVIGRRMAVAHNAQFDFAIAAWRYNLNARHLACTQQMAYAVLMNRLDNFEMDSLAKHFGHEGKNSDILKRIAGKRRDDISSDEWSELNSYAENDAVQEAKVFAGLAARFPKSQYRQMDWCLRQFVDPVLKTDRAALQQALDDLIATEEKAFAKYGVSVKEMRSGRGDFFAGILRSLGVEPPTEISPRTGKEKWAFSKQSKEFMDIAEGHPSRVVRDMCELKLLSSSSIHQSRLKRMLAVDKACGGKLPIAVKYSGARTTHRMSGFDSVNHLNMPKKGAIRGAISALGRGEKVCVSDLSGAELRICRTMTGDDRTIRMINTGGDPYCDFAETVFGITTVKDRSKDDDNRRFVGKVCHLSLQYQTGAEKLKHTVWSWGRVIMADDVAKEAVKIFRYKKHQPVKKYWDYIENELFLILSNRGEGVVRGAEFIKISDGKLILPSGLWLDFPNLKQVPDEKFGAAWVMDKAHGRYSTIKQDSTYGGRQLENLCQSLTNEVLTDKMYKLEDAGIRCAHTVYDEVVAIVPPGRESFVEQTMNDIMSAPVDWWPELQLASETCVANNYGDAK